MLNRIRQEIFLHQFAEAEAKLAVVKPQSEVEKDIVGDLKAYLEQEKFVYNCFNRIPTTLPLAFTPKVLAPEYVMLNGFKEMAIVLMNNHAEPDSYLKARLFFLSCYQNNHDKFFSMLWHTRLRRSEYDPIQTLLYSLITDNSTRVSEIINEFIAHLKSHNQKRIAQRALAYALFSYNYNLPAAEFEKNIKTFLNFYYPEIPETVYMAHHSPSNYTLKARLGAGGSATVFMGENSKKEKRVIKQFNEDGRHEMLPELVALSVLNSGGGHPNVIGFESFDLLSFTLVLPYVEMSCSMYTYIASNATEDLCGIAFKESIAQQSISGLAYMHSLNVVHSDVSPQNLLFSVDRAGNIHAKWIDLGAFQLVGPPHLPRECRNYFDYAAYELFFGSDTISHTDFIKFNQDKLNNAYKIEDLDEGLHHSPASDVCSWAFVIKALFSWKLPQHHNMDTQTTMHQGRKKYVYDNADPCADIPSITPTHVKSVLLRALQWDPQKRPTASVIGNSLSTRLLP